MSDLIQYNNFKQIVLNQIPLIDVRAPIEFEKGAFPNDKALLKLLYLRVTELYRKWGDSSVRNWAMVRNQLDIDERIQARIRKYE